MMMMMMMMMLVVYNYSDADIDGVIVLTLNLLQIVSQWWERALQCRISVMPLGGTSLQNMREEDDPRIGGSTRCLQQP